MSGWKSSSVLSTSKPTISAKRRTETSETHKNRTKKAKQIAEDGTWADRFQPQTRHELAIHKKKVDEVDQWLQNNTGNTELTKNNG